MLDFASALYLGLCHASDSLPGWNCLTLGRPAALEESPQAAGFAARLARLQGCEAALIARSTLHLFCDLGQMLGGWTVLVDAESYAIARWGLERAQLRGARVKTFGHHDLRSLRTQIERSESMQRFAIVCDGFCPICRRWAPLEKYLEVVRRYDGLLVVDDTQALGIWGKRGGSAAKSGEYGLGGGGCLPALDLADPRIVLIASLSKAFGAPVAALSGSRGFVAGFRERSATRVACSPASNAVLNAGSSALAINARMGDQLRARLLRRVRLFRAALRDHGVALEPGTFPIQTLAHGRAGRVAENLQKRGIKAVLHRGPERSREQLSLIVTAAHRPQELRLGAACVASAVREAAAELRSISRRRANHVENEEWEACGVTTLECTARDPSAASSVTPT